MPRTIAIGDIHGCAAALQAIADALQLQPDDTLITLGDYVDRGPDSRGVIERLIQLAAQCTLIPLLGNHEIIMLSVAEGSAPLEFWLDDCGGAATLASYQGGLQDIPAAHWDFIRACRRYHETDEHIFLHANYVATLTLAEQPDEVLFWRHMLRLPPPHFSQKTVFVGHTPQRNCRILDAGHVVGLDTWVYGDGCLTAYDVHNGHRWQADKMGKLINAPPKK